MVDSVKFQKIPNTERAYAIIIKCWNESILCINMYLLVDNQKKTHVEPDFIETLEAVDMYIEQSNIINVILAGDLNVDFSCKNAHDVYFNDNCIRTDMKFTFNI